MSAESEARRSFELALEAEAHRPKAKISRLHVAVYLAYGGSDDAYAWRNRPDPIMFNGAWRLVERLIQIMAPVSSGLCSEKYREDVEAALMESTEDIETRELLWSVSWFQDFWKPGRGSASDV